MRGSFKHSAYKWSGCYYKDEINLQLDIAWHNYYT